MTHDNHEALPGYHPDQILHDGCGECEERAQSADHGIGGLDVPAFRRAWERAATWKREGLPSIAYAEIPMLSVLWAVQCQVAGTRRAGRELRSRLGL
jgi:hypothetical protein